MRFFTRLYPQLFLTFCLFFSFLALPSASRGQAQQTPGAKITLHSGWQLQSSCAIHAEGKEISTPGFAIAGWHRASVPSTVVAALVADGTYQDPYFGMNLRSLPGMDYPVGKMFSVLPMPQDSPFRCSWWYRVEFGTPEMRDGDRVWLNFGGINNRANIWLNGHRIADSRDVAGAYRTYEFDVTPWLARGGNNALAVETIAQTEDDLGINWVDWNPTPPDKNMGLWRDVSLRATGSVKIAHPQVVTHFADASLNSADLVVEVPLQNATDQGASVNVVANLEGLTLRQVAMLGPNESRTVRFTPADFPGLRVRDPKLWWPRQMGEPSLHTLSVQALQGGNVSDATSIRYGIREVTSELDANGHRLFRVNGKRILIRGGGWAPDMLLRGDPERLKTEFRYVRDLNLNAIRLEGKLETDEFYDLADEQGLLILAGWCCCDHWEQWAKWRPGDLEIATASLRSQILRMRSHPSMLVWMNGSDNPPPPDVEQAYASVLRSADWPNPYLASASEKTTGGAEPTGVKMMGPYDYVPPDYWLADTKSFGGAFGFSTEISPGAAVPPLASLRKMLPAEATDPSTAAWNYHAGSQGFANLKIFNDAMREVYGAPRDLDDYERKAQAMAYDGERAMFEAYSRNKYASTGVIQWMLNNAWPSLIWHLYDYFLQPAGGYFGAKKALEPLHVQYSYDDGSVVVVNSTYQAFSGLRVRAQLFSEDLKELSASEKPVDVKADGVAKAFILPRESQHVSFVRLALEDPIGKILSRNFYWLGAGSNSYNWMATDYKYTPVAAHENLQALNSLPAAGRVDVMAMAGFGDEGPRVLVKLRNSSHSLAFQVRLGIRRSREEAEILPALWDDNYIELMPGEERDLTAEFFSRDALAGGAEVTIDGWNVDSASIPIAMASGSR